APIWNIRDEDVPWVAELSRVVDGDKQTDGGVHDGWLEHDFGAGFGPVERGLFRHAVPMTADLLVQLVASRSYYITATPERKAATEAAVGGLAAGLPEHFDLPYVTVTYRSYRR